MIEDCDDVTTWDMECPARVAGGVMTLSDVGSE